MLSGQARQTDVPLPEGAMSDSTSCRGREVFVENRAIDRLQG